MDIFKKMFTNENKITLTNKIIEAEIEEENL